MDTLFLAPASWDLVLDSSANIALAEEPYSLAQDAASAIKTFAGDIYFDSTQGVPYFSNILGQLPSLTYVRSQFVNAALTVPDVVATQVFFSSFNSRTLSGQVQVTNKAGVITATGF
jgi:hypothetical protein